jgi:dethiobiotin synthase
LPPVSTPAGRNDDVENLLAASSLQPPREWVNPYGFKAAIAPHIAAEEEGRRIELPHIVATFAQLQALADAVVVEGVGGFCVPLGRAYDTADLAAALQLPVLLVVGMRLGCINHALLTQQADRHPWSDSRRLGSKPHRPGNVALQRESGGPAGAARGAPARRRRTRYDPRESCPGTAPSSSLRVSSENCHECKQEKKSPTAKRSGFSAFRSATSNDHQARSKITAMP